MDLTTIFFLVAVPAVLFAGISKGGFAGGGAFVATTIMAMVAEPVFAISIMLPILLLIDVLTLKIYWRQWVGQLALYLVIGGFIGVVLGALIFRDADPDLIRVLIGAISIGFVVFQGAKSIGWLPTSTLPLRIFPATVAGMASGFTSFVAHAGSPPFAIYVLRQAITKTEYQATAVVVFWWINLSKLPFYGASGMFPTNFWLIFAILAPAAFLGTFIGAWLSKRMPEKIFFGTVYFFLIIGGTRLLYDGLT